jgi:membrane-bound serine protease (ClpP class)
MKSFIRRAFITGLCSFFAFAANAANNPVVVLEIDGGIGVATADYVSSGIRHAEEQNAELIIIDIDTPGGLVKPMRDIVQDILGSTVPIATYVTPAGARADSAGTYILLASHIAAMAPTTHLGAATPVSLNGEDATPADPGGRPNQESADDEPDGDEEAVEPAPLPGSAMERKVLNDAIAYIRGLAERHGRNAEWAEKAVTEAATLTAEEALEQNVIEFIAVDHQDLLQQLDGYEVQAGSQTIALETGDTTIEEFEPNWRIKVLSVIANPEIVLLLGIIGLYGLMYEGWNPGAIVPGVVGVICLLLAAYALQVLPVNYAGLACTELRRARTRRHRRLRLRRDHDVRQWHSRIRHFSGFCDRSRDSCSAGNNLARRLCPQAAQARRRVRARIDYRRCGNRHGGLQRRRQDLAGG